MTEMDMQGIAWKYCKGSPNPEIERILWISLMAAIREAVEAERERCALICEFWYDIPGVGADPGDLALAIRQSELSEDK